MKRRTFITLLGGAATWPLAAWAQALIPVIGFLRSTPPEGAGHLLAGLHQGLSEAGFVEGRNIAIEYRWGDGHVDRLPALAADLVRRQVSVILASATNAALAAKAATSTIPIVFVVAADPVEAGLVASLNRPGGNATGVYYLTAVLGGKRLELVQQLVPGAKNVAALVYAGHPTTEPFVRDLKAGAAVLGLQLTVSAVTGEHQLESAFATLAKQRPDALIVGAAPLFTSRSADVVALAARHTLPAIYTTADPVRAGGLIGWGAHLGDQYRAAGTYVGKILKGTKPEDLPALQPIRYDLVINLKTAKALGIDVPAKLIALADEVIE